MKLFVDVFKAGSAHLPEGAERCAYSVPSEYGVIYIPINRLRQVYQTDKATNPDKVRALVSRMKKHDNVAPVEIGYNYDIQDGHHRYTASEELDYTHVPCIVVGTDESKIKEAKEMYRSVWKSDSNDLKPLIEQNLRSEETAIQDYQKLIVNITDNKILPIIEEILNDEKDHHHNLAQVLLYVEGDKTALTGGKLKKSEDILSLVLDLEKGRMLHKDKLVKRAVQVIGKNGKTFTRMQWVDPKTGQPASRGHKIETEAPPKHHASEHPKVDKEIDWDDDSIWGGDEDVEVRDRDEEDAKEPEPGENPKPKSKPKSKEKPDIAPEEADPEDKDPEDEDEFPTIEELQRRKKAKLAGMNKVKTSTKESNRGSQTTFVSDIEHFENVIKKKYTHDYIMDQADKQGITWQRLDQYGEMFSPPMNWMRAASAIKHLIRNGGVFEIADNAKDTDKVMQEKNKSTVEKHFLSLLEKHGGNKQELMEWARNNDYGWKEKEDPVMNWMYFKKHIMTLLSQGKMVGGVRTQQKELMSRTNATITPDIQNQVKLLGQNYDRSDIMARAEEYGLNWIHEDKKGNTLHPAVAWMRCSSEIQLWIAQGHEFLMDGKNPNKGVTSASAQIEGVKLGKHQAYALDFAGRNSKNYEEKARKWAIKSVMVDNPKLTDSDADEYYRKFVSNAYNARIMVHLDPLEKLPGGVTILEQFSSDGHMKNPFQMGGIDTEAQEITEREIYGEGFDEAPPRERPIYGSIDLFNQGLDSSGYGSIALVLKNDVKDRSSVTMGDSNSLPWETNGKLTRHATSPHHALVDRWTSKWANPKKPDKVRQRAMDAVVNGTRNNEAGFFEAQILGGVDFKRDVDHVLVPQDWSTNRDHKDKHEKVQAFAKLHDIQVKYE